MAAEIRLKTAQHYVALDAKIAAADAAAADQEECMDSCDTGEVAGTLFHEIHEVCH